MRLPEAPERGAPFDGTGWHRPTAPGAAVPTLSASFSDSRHEALLRGSRVARTHRGVHVMRRGAPPEGWCTARGRSGRYGRAGRPGRAPARRPKRPPAPARRAARPRLERFRSGDAVEAGSTLTAQRRTVRQRPGRSDTSPIHAFRQHDGAGARDHHVLAHHDLNAAHDACLRRWERQGLTTQMAIAVLRTHRETGNHGRGNQLATSQAHQLDARHLGGIDA